VNPKPQPPGADAAQLQTPAHVPVMHPGLPLRECNLILEHVPKSEGTDMLWRNPEQAE
jgi:hypothetical protein